MWIDFKLYFYVSNHKVVLRVVVLFNVVNWFQIVFLREQSQVSSFYLQHRRRCELISNCIFTWAITRKILVATMLLGCELISNCIFTWAITRHSLDFETEATLWIDFKLYFYVSNHKIHAEHRSIIDVVNWFQIVFLREQSQGCC